MKGLGGCDAAVVVDDAFQKSAEMSTGEKNGRHLNSGEHELDTSDKEKSTILCRR